MFVCAVEASLGKWLDDVYRVGLTEYRALAHLAQAPDKELRVNDLAQRVDLNQSSVTRLVSRTTRNPIPAREADPPSAAERHPAQRVNYSARKSALREHRAGSISRAAGGSPCSPR